MRKEINFEYQKSDKKYLDNKLKGLFSLFKIQINTAFSIAKGYLGNIPLYIELKAHEEQTGKLTLIFKTDSNKTLEIGINESKISVKDHEIEDIYEYILGDKIECRLISTTFKDKEKTICEKEDNHRIIISITVGSKAFCINTDLDFTSYFDSAFFSSINENSTIFDLRKLYLKSIFPLQGGFSRKEATTMEVVTFITGSVIISDRLKLKDGFVVEYSLNSYKDGMIVEASGTIPINPEYKIYNYNGHVAINPIIEDLRQKTDELNGIIRL